MVSKEEIEEKIRYLEGERERVEREIYNLKQRRSQLELRSEGKYTEEMGKIDYELAMLEGVLTDINKQLRYLQQTSKTLPQGQQPSQPPSTPPSTPSQPPSGSGAGGPVGGAAAGPAPGGWVDKYYQMLYKRAKEREEAGKKKFWEEIPDFIYYPALLFFSFYAAWGGIPMNYFIPILPLIIFFLILGIICVIKRNEIAEVYSGGNEELREQMRKKWGIGNFICRIVVTVLVLAVASTYIMPWAAMAHAQFWLFLLAMVGIFIALIPHLIKIPAYPVVGKRAARGYRKVTGRLAGIPNWVFYVFGAAMFLICFLGGMFAGVFFKPEFWIPLIAIFGLTSVLYAYLGLGDVKYTMGTLGTLLSPILFLATLIIIFLIVSGSLVLALPAVGMSPGVADIIGVYGGRPTGIGYPIFGVIGGAIFTFIFYSIFGAIMPRGWLSFVISLVPMCLLVFLVFPMILPILNIKIQPILPVVGWKLGVAWSTSWSLTNLYKALDYQRYLQQVQSQYETLWCDVYGVECKGSEAEKMPTGGIGIEDFKAYGVGYCGEPFTIEAKVRNYADYATDVTVLPLRPYGEEAFSWLRVLGLTHWTCVEELQIPDGCKTDYTLRPKQVEYYTCNNVNISKREGVTQLSCPISLGVEMAQTSISRLPITFIDQNYSLALTDAHLLTPAEIPAIVSLGPLKLNINVGNQPVELKKEKGRNLTIRISSGRASLTAGSVKISNYFLFLPKNFGKCLEAGDFECFDVNTSITTWCQSQVYSYTIGCDYSKIWIDDVTFRAGGLLDFRLKADDIRISRVDVELNWGSGYGINTYYPQVQNVTESGIAVEMQFNVPTDLRPGSTVNILFNISYYPTSITSAVTTCQGTITTSSYLFCSEMSAGPLEKLRGALKDSYYECMLKNPAMGRVEEFKIYICPISVDYSLLRDRKISTYLVFAGATYTYMTEASTTATCLVS